MKKLRTFLSEMIRIFFKSQLTEKHIWVIALGIVSIGFFYVSDGKMAMLFLTHFA